VILDLSVPGGMGGAEAIGRLREIDPGVRAIVSSGYSNDKVLANFQSFGFCAFLPKPYDTRTLAMVMEQAVAPAPS
jgi:DNA-binding NarL/FixJ family response regulator